MSLQLGQIFGNDKVVRKCFQLAFWNISSYRESFIQASGRTTISHSWAARELLAPSSTDDFKDRVQRWTQQCWSKCHHSFLYFFIHSVLKMLNIDICVASFRKKDLFRWNRTMDHIIFVLTGNKPTTHRSCHFSKWLPIKQNDFVVHHHLNSAWNVINLYKSWKHCLYLHSDSDKLQGRCLVMMFDCQPRITSEREKSSLL